MSLFDWTEFGRVDRIGTSKRIVRGWLFAARGHVPIIDRVNFPDAHKLYPGAGDN
jgi:hypothetical protein